MEQVSEQEVEIVSKEAEPEDVQVMTMCARCLRQRAMEQVSEVVSKEAEPEHVQVTMEQVSEQEVEVVSKEAEPEDVQVSVRKVLRQEDENTTMEQVSEQEVEVVSREAEPEDVQVSVRKVLRQEDENTTMEQVSEQEVEVVSKEAEPEDVQVSVRKVLRQEDENTTMEQVSEQEVEVVSKEAEPEDVQVSVRKVLRQEDENTTMEQVSEQEVEVVSKEAEPEDVQVMTMEQVSEQEVEVVSKEAEPGEDVQVSACKVLRQEDENTTMEQVSEQEVEVVSREAEPEDVQVSLSKVSSQEDENMTMEQVSEQEPFEEYNRPSISYFQFATSAHSDVSTDGYVSGSVEDDSDYDPWFVLDGQQAQDDSDSASSDTIEVPKTVRKTTESRIPVQADVSANEDHNDSYTLDIQKDKTTAPGKSAEISEELAFQETSRETETDSSNHTHTHEHLPEEHIMRCNKVPGIFVRKITYNDGAGDKCRNTRVYNNYHCCCICGFLASNILKHLRTHKTNPEVAAMLALERKEEKNANDKRDIDLMHALLRNKGDHKHNMTVKNTKQGEYLISRRQVPFESAEYIPCPMCLEWIKGGTMGRHQKSCVNVTKNTKLSKGQAIVQSAVITGSLNPQASAKLIAEVYPIMTRDKVTAKAQGDPLIIALGNNWLRMNIDNALKRKYYTSSRMRGAGRLLGHLQDITGTSHSMAEYLKPDFFDAMAEAALRCGSQDIDDEEELAHPSAAIKVGFDIKRMANIKIGLALRQHDHESKQATADFAVLMNMEWTGKVSKIAHKLLRERKMNKRAHLPVPSDLASLATYLVKELSSLDIDVTKPALDESEAHYKRIVMLTQTRLLMYNKRRSGELEATT